MKKSSRNAQDIADLQEELDYQIGAPITVLRDDTKVLTFWQDEKTFEVFDPVGTVAYYLTLTEAVHAFEKHKARKRPVFKL